MKKLFIIASIFSIYSCNSRKNISYENTSAQISNDQYKVIDIDSIGKAYLIYVKRNDSVFRVASLKEKITPCNKIRINEFYDLKLVSSMGDKPQKLDISGIEVEENTLVMLDNTNGAIHDLFFADSFRGLCWLG